MSGTEKLPWSSSIDQQFCSKWPIDSKWSIDQWFCSKSLSLTCTEWEIRRFPAASQRRFSATGWPRTGGGSKSFFPPSFKQKRWSSGVLKRAVIFVWIQTNKSIKAKNRHLALLHFDRLEVVLNCWSQVWRYLLVDHHLVVSIVFLLKQHFGGRIIVLEGLCEGWRFTSAFEKLSYPSLPFPR